VKQNRYVGKNIIENNIYILHIIHIYVYIYNIYNDKVHIAKFTSSKELEIQKS